MANELNSTDTFLRSIDRYTIKDRVGTGGMARVYRAIDTALDRDVAVKVLHEYLADDPTFRARFEREAKFLASFQHPNVVPIYDYATVEREQGYFCYMVMSYLPGETLKDVIDRNDEAGKLMPHKRVLGIMQDITAALQYAHEMGMVHRDIKPANILFDSSDRAILSDFGIARMVENSQLTQENVAVGTPAYMAPEQAAGEPVDSRTDIYALGIILYELLAGSPPFGNDSSISVLMKHINEPVPALTTYPHIENPYLDAVVEKALAKQPDDRYQRATDLAADLKRALNNETPQRTTSIGQTPLVATPVPRPVGRPTKAAPPKSQNSPVGILIAGLLIILIVVMAAFLVDFASAPNAPTPAQPESSVLIAADSMVSEADGNIAPSMTTMENASFVSNFDDEDTLLGDYWLLNTQVDEDRPGMIVRERADEGYRISNSIPGSAGTSVLVDFIYTNNITIMSELTLHADSPSSSGYGLVFHYTDPANYGVFAVDGNGNYSIWFLVDNNWRELRDEADEWTFSPAVNPTGETNLLRLEIRGETLKGYVNDEQVVEVQDGALTGGEVGMYLATPRSGGEAVITTDYYEVIVADDTTAPSMTYE